MFSLEKSIIYLSGLALGVFGVLLYVWGNPSHTGICASCFIENISGALGLHSNIRMQYLRPEIIGFTLGSFLLALFTKEFRSRGNSSPLISFIFGMLLIIGSAVFIGCPIKLMLRLSSGEVSVFIGLAGLILGIWIGIQFLKDGFTLGETQDVPKTNGIIIPLLMMVLLLLLLFKPSFINFSISGPGSMHAPLLVSLFAGLFIGMISQRSRFCVTGSIRNFLLAGDYNLLLGLILLIISALVTNILTNNFELTPVRADFLNEYMWEFLSMLLVGWASLFAGGCPFRQLIIAGEGNTDAGMCVLGMITAGGIVQSFDIYTTSDGVSFTGKLSVLTGLLILIVIGLAFREKFE